jgi:hypothetical protein
MDAPLEALSQDWEIAEAPIPEEHIAEAKGFQKLG